ncbi:MAG: hypothetical protein A3H96_12350 [Acidobacteria bacterium RIFCSPLOWO2_02_FULL_67_36]|nr:MAG: hypothetical protein A3H96_12350 [Acidobacteria bacterium RIFCSPLOWO2_02_FULL_67_36]
MSGIVRLLGRAIRWGLLVAGALSTLGFLWLLAGLPLLIDAPLNVAAAPAQADAIICIGGGTTSHDLPTAEGWQRIYTSVQLLADHYAPVVVFTGRGNEKVSEAEIYADAARWLGMPADAARLDPLPAGTADHPATLLKSLAGTITRDSRLLLVTSNVHSRRVLMTFRKKGFTHVRVVSDYTARARSPLDTRKAVSTLPAFQSDSKQYGDPMFTLIQRSSVLLRALREWTAIGVYWWKGQV